MKVYICFLGLLVAFWLVGCGMADDEDIIYELYPGEVSNTKTINFTVGQGYNINARTRNDCVPYMHAEIVEYDPGSSGFVTVHYRIIMAEKVEIGKVYYAQIIISYVDPVFSIGGATEDKKYVHAKAVERPVEQEKE